MSASESCWDNGARAAALHPFLATLGISDWTLYAHEYTIQTFGRTGTEEDALTLRAVLEIVGDP